MFTRIVSCKALCMKGMRLSHATVHFKYNAETQCYMQDTYNTAPLSGDKRSQWIIATIAMYLQCLPKNCEVDHLTLGSSSIPFVTFFWDTLYVPSMCEIYKSFQVTPHCTEQTLCTVWRKSWPCFRKLPRRQHVDMHGLQLRIPIPDPVWSLHSCLGLRV